jgi:phage terminase large subunit-like protein
VCWTNHPKRPRRPTLLVRPGHGVNARPGCAGRMEDDGAVLCWFWSPEGTVLEHQHNDRAPYTVWVREGHLLTTPGRTINLRAPVLKLGELMQRFDVRGVAHDRFRIDELRRLIDEEGVDAPLVDFGQGYRDMAGAIDATERAILDQRVRHEGHPILTWNIANLVITMDPSGNRKPDKARANDRVDGAVAMVMAIGLHAREPAPITYDFSMPMVLTA